MRYVFGFLCVCALGAVSGAGCDWDWDDPCPSCEGVVCRPDDSECTVEHCWCGSCTSTPVEDGTGCTYDGLFGVCVEGACGENLCEDIVCDDGLACTVDTCGYRDGMCHFEDVCDDENNCTEDFCSPRDGMCDFTTPAEDGTACHLYFDGVDAEGTCEAGVCAAPCDPASEEAVQCPLGMGYEDSVCCPGTPYCLFYWECEF